MWLWTRTIFAKIVAVFRRNRLEHELDEEVRGHLTTLEERFVQQGMTLEEARYAARRAFGGVEQLKELHREQRSLQLFDRTRLDVRFALRSLRKSPSFSIVVILTLALGIGAGAAVFSVVQTVLLRPLPYPEPDLLVGVWVRDTVSGQRYLDVSPSEFIALKEGARSLSKVAAYSLTVRQVADPAGRGTRLTVARATDGLLSLLGTSFAIGRDFSEEEYRLQKPVVILNHRLWKGRYTGEPDIIGKTIYIQQEPHEIVGVLSHDQEFPRGADILRPIRTSESEDGDREFSVLARLRHDVNIDRAGEEAALLVQGVSQQRSSPGSRPGGRFSASVQPLQTILVKDVRVVLLMLLAAVGLVVLMVCVNVAGLFLARAATRRREMALRAALGAGRTRLAGLCLAESLILSAAGGLLGIAFGHLLLKTIIALVPQEVPRLSQVVLDTPATALMAGVAIACGLLFGLAPAWMESIVDVRAGLAASKADFGRPRGLRFRRCLVTAQVVLSTILVAGAVQVTAGFQNMLEFDRGFRNLDLVEVQIDSRQAATPASTISLYDSLRSVVKGLPGVHSAEVANFSALFTRSLRRPIQIEAAESTRTPVEVNIGIVSPDYFQTLAVPLREGRYFSTATDYRGGPPVAIVNQAFVDALLPDSDPLGRLVDISDFSEPALKRRIVGVVADLRAGVQSVPAPTVHLPFGQEVWPSMNMLIGISTEDASMVVPLIREQIWAQAPDVTLDNIGTLRDKIAGSLITPHFSATAVTVLAMLALILASVGLYGLLTHLVSNRKRELAIRRAVGASNLGILLLVLRHGMTLTLAGLAIGVPGALISAQLVSASVYRVGWLDSSNLMTSVLVIGSVAILACLIPAIRAVRIDPIKALREE